MKPHSIIPCDILLKNGRCLVDESSLNGESAPVIKDPIDQYPNDYTFTETEDYDISTGVKTRYPSSIPPAERI